MWGTPSTDFIYVFDLYNRSNGLVVLKVLDINEYVGERGYLRYTKHKLTDQKDHELDDIVGDYLAMRRHVEGDIHGRGVYLVASKIPLTPGTVMAIHNNMKVEAREVLLKELKL
jgi:hypothetical protein